MELDEFKSAWQNRPADDPSLLSAAPSVSLRFLRTSTMRDLQKSSDLCRVFLNLLFALLLIGISSRVMLTAAGQIAAWLFAVALIADGTLSLTLLMQRLRSPATATMFEFISREHRSLESRLQFERLSRYIMYTLGVITLAILIFGPKPDSSREIALDAMSRMGLMVGFLAVAWRRAKSRSTEAHRELGRYLKELRA